MHDPALLRYFFFLVSLGAVSTELETLEEHLGDLFGRPDEIHPMVF